jgi:hypothetical protein
MKQIGWIVGLGAVIALAGCERRMDSKQAEKGIGEHFGKFAPVEQVTCPKGIALKKDTKFECTLRFTGGDQFKVNAVIDSVKDNEGHYQFKIDEPVFEPKPTAEWLAAEITKQSGTEAKVDCGAPRHPKADDTCVATAPDGTKANVSIKVGADGKPQSFEVKKQ